MLQLALFSRVSSEVSPPLEHSVFASPQAKAKLVAMNLCLLISLSVEFTETRQTHTFHLWNLMNLKRTFMHPHTRRWFLSQSAVLTLHLILDCSCDDVCCADTDTHITHVLSFWNVDGWMGKHTRKTTHKFLSQAAVWNGIAHTQTHTSQSGVLMRPQTSTNTHTWAHTHTALSHSGVFKISHLLQSHQYDL